MISAIFEACRLITIAILCVSGGLAVVVLWERLMRALVELMERVDR